MSQICNEICNEVSKDGLRATWREIIIKTRSEFYKTLVMR